MFPFLKNFPDLRKMHWFYDCAQDLASIMPDRKDSFDVDCDITYIRSIDPINFSRYLKCLWEDTLYERWDGLGCDYLYIKTFLEGEKKIFLFFKILNSKINLKQEYKEVFVDTMVNFEEDCFHRLIIWNCSESSENKFEKGEDYKVYSIYREGENVLLLNNYTEMEKTVLIYWVSPEAIQNFKELKKVNIEKNKFL